MNVVTLILEDSFLSSLTAFMNRSRANLKKKSTKSVRCDLPRQYMCEHAQLSSQEATRVASMQKLGIRDHWRSRWPTALFQHVSTHHNS